MISACLLGINCKYNGDNNYNFKIECEVMKEENILAICPEVLGGLATPRLPSEIQICNGTKRVINNEGEDVTENFEKGAKLVLDFAKKLNVTKAILKSKSPSCGCNKVYDGTFTGKVTEGNGILTELLLANGIEVISSDEYE